MIDKIISLLLYIGVTFLAGYGLWEISSLTGTYAVAVSIVGVIMFVIGGLKFKDSNKHFTQFLGIVGSSYMGTLAYKMMDLIPTTNEFLFNLKILLSSILIFSYFYCYNKKISDSLLFNILKALSFIGMIISALNMVRIYFQIDLIVSLLSFLGIWEIHKSQIVGQSSLIKKLDEFFKILGESLKPSQDLLNLGTLSFLILILISPIDIDQYGYLPFFCFSALFFWLLMALNNKLKTVILGFWISLGVMFYQIYDVINIQTSMLILIIGAICLLLAYALKKIKENPKVFEKLKHHIPSFLKKYEIKE